MSLANRIFLSVRRIRAVTTILLLAALASPICQARDDSATSVGEAIYRNGVTGSGKPLVAARQVGVKMEGRDAACINCHRRSGFGAKEGLIAVPPIAGRYLFHPRAATAEDLDLPYVENMRVDRAPYTDTTLARAIRDGLDSEGKPFNYLMPHFALNDGDMASLIDYLKQLDQRKLPGVSSTTLHFATIVTPDADPVKARGMLDVIEQYFEDRNASQRSQTANMRPSGKAMFSKMMLLVNRRWELHVWRLTGPASTWRQQLEQHFAKEPVLAVVSGLGGKNWAPIHAFCEHQAVPCLFPNIETPPANADRDFYSLYFSRGVELEAGLIANNILKPDKGKTAKAVHQIYRAGDSGEAGAQALAAALEGHGIKVRSHMIAADAPARSVAKALKQVPNRDALVLWLRPPDIAALDKTPPAPAVVYMSGLMGGLERAPLSPSWRDRILLTYPFALPEQRRVGVDFALGWFRIKHIPVVAEQVQADTYLACGLLSETLRHMVDAFVPEYLVERVQDKLAHRIITGYYPRLELAPGQRFASKGGYIVHFSGSHGTHLIADNNWSVP